MNENIKINDIMDKEQKWSFSQQFIQSILNIKINRGKKDKATMAVLEQTKLFGYVWVS